MCSIILWDTKLINYVIFDGVGVQVVKMIPHGAVGLRAMAPRPHPNTNHTSAKVCRCVRGFVWGYVCECVGDSMYTCKCMWWWRNRAGQGRFMIGVSGWSHNLHHSTRFLLPINFLIFISSYKLNTDHRYDSIPVFSTIANVIILGNISNSFRIVQWKRYKYRRYQIISRYNATYNDVSAKVHGVITMVTTNTILRELMMLVRRSIIKVARL